MLWFLRFQSLGQRLFYKIYSFNNSKVAPRGKSFLVGLKAVTIVADLLVADCWLWSQATTIVIAG